VAALAQQAAFAAPPAPVRDDAGYVRDEPWPEIDYLVRMTKLVPEDVVNVAVDLLPSENAWVCHFPQSKRLSSRRTLSGR
jgi:hypothetical protein